MQIPPTRGSPSPLRLHREDAADDVERALAVLRATPYGPDATEEQEWACRLLYRTLLGRLSGICRRLGLDDEEVANVVHPELHQFFTRDVRRIGPTRADLERWMVAVCRNAARTALAARIKRAARDREATQLLVVEADAEAPPGDGGEREEATDDAAARDEPRWLDAAFPEQVDRDRFVAAVAGLTPREQLLLTTAFRSLRGREGPGGRLPATEIARDLGMTPASVSVRWSELMAKLRRACGVPSRSVV